ncbi:uncharacterized protein LOC108671994, partial [Hyalella azteca]|uniref:Uncharacterized protein LOC108671994 n=1 Tax=Hyalella azteca TaxID=294128 RepID=A0A8B7NN33_HYAAZ
LLYSSVAIHWYCYTSVLPYPSVAILSPDSPASVERCSVHNRTPSSLHVTCRPATSSAGRYYMAVVEEPVSGRMVANISSESPDFIIRPLDPDPDYAVRVFSVNVRGRSLPYLLESFSLKVAENRMDADTTPPGTASPLLAGIIGSVVVLLALLTTSLLAATLRRYRARTLTAGRAVSLPSDCADKETADGISVNGDTTLGEYSSGSLAGGSHLLLPVQDKGDRRSSSSGGMQDFCREFAHLESSAAETPTPAAVQPERDIAISRNATFSPRIQDSAATNPALYSCGYRYIRRGSEFTCNDTSDRNEIPHGTEQRRVGFRVDESLLRHDRTEECGSLDRRSMPSRIKDLRKEIGVNDDVMWGSPGHSTDADTTPPGTASSLLAGIIGSVVVLLALLTTSLLAASLRRYRARRLTAGRAVSLPSDCADKETADGISVNGDTTPGEYSSGSLAGGSHLLLPVQDKGDRRSSSSGGMQDFCREFAHLESSAAETPTPAAVQNSDAALELFQQQQSFQKSQRVLWFRKLDILSPPS